MNDYVPSDAWLRFYLLGGCEIQLPEGSVRLESAKTRALLVYLVLNPGPQERHKLIGLLWGDFPEANARRNLRRALWNLRKELNNPELPPVILADRETVAINDQTPFWVDVGVFQEACTQLSQISSQPSPSDSTGQAPSSPTLEQLRPLIDLYQGDFLDGFYVDNAPAFEDWVFLERERTRVLALNAIQHLAEEYESSNQNSNALHYARRLVSIEPLREESHRQIMRLLALNDQRNAALAQYRTCRQLLAEELEVEPSDET